MNDDAGRKRFSKCFFGYQEMFSHIPICHGPRMGRHFYKIIPRTTYCPAPFPLAISFSAVIHKHLNTNPGLPEAPTRFLRSPVLPPRQVSPGRPRAPGPKGNSQNYREEALGLEARSKHLHEVLRQPYRPSPDGGPVALMEQPTPGALLILICSHTPSNLEFPGSPGKAGQEGRPPRQFFNRWKKRRSHSLTSRNSF
jgi:hypothetical protein